MQKIGLGKVNFRFGFNNGRSGIQLMSALSLNAEIG
jgi:hypothetical protein